MKKFIKDNIGLIMGYLYVVIGLVLIVSNSIQAYAYYTQEDKKLTDFYEKDKRYVDVEMVFGLIDNYMDEMNISSNQDEIEIDIEKDYTEDAMKEYDYDEYVSVIKIPKIKLEKGLFAKNSKYNDVEHNIMIHESSDTPTVDKGNVILVAHSGTSNVSYFKYLHKMKIGDISEIYYHGRKYTYKVTDIYEVEKTGYVQINRDKEKNTLTLITCKHNTDMQIVVISELDSVEFY